MKALPRWGEGIVGRKVPDSVLETRLGTDLISRVELFKVPALVHGLEDWQVRGVDLLGVGGVWTASAHRRRGYASALLRQVPQVVGALGANGSILFTLEELIPFYENLGWREVSGDVSMQQPDGRVEVPELVHVMVALDDVDVEAPLTIESLPW